MLMKVLLTTEEVAAAVTDYLNVRHPELMKEFRISEVYDEKLSYTKLLRVTLSNEPVVAKDGRAELRQAEIDEDKDEGSEYD